MLVQRIIATLVACVAVTGLAACAGASDAPVVDKTQSSYDRPKNVIECADAGISLDRGDTNAVCIKALQDYLATFGVANNGVADPPAQTGVYDAATVKAVVEYETNWNRVSGQMKLNPDDAAGNDTIATMAAM